MKKLPRLSLIALCTSIFFSATASSTIGGSDLKLWQIKYSADTKFEDGYYIEGTAQQFSGKFLFENGFLEFVETRIPVKSLSTGLLARDISIREILFEDDQGQFPDIVFRLSDAVSCSQLENFHYCEGKGELSIRGEFQNLNVGVYVGTYENQTWLHADLEIKLSDYQFYQNGSPALKVADLINLSVDLLADPS